MALSELLPYSSSSDGGFDDSSDDESSAPPFIGPIDRENEENALVNDQRLVSPNEHRLSERAREVVCIGSPVLRGLSNEEQITIRRDDAKVRTEARRLEEGFLADDVSAFVSLLRPKNFRPDRASVPSTRASEIPVCHQMPRSKSSLAT